LYDLPDAGSFFFKGGTSLSKAFNVIQRFSEDIDLIIDRARFGYTGNDDIASAPSKTAASRRLEQLATDISAYIASNVVPQLAERFGAVLTEQSQLRQIHPGINSLGARGRSDTSVSARLSCDARHDLRGAPVVS